MLQQVDEGQGAVVVAKEYRRRFGAVPGHLQQVFVLPVVVGHRHLPHRLSLGISGAHVLGAAAQIALDEGVRSLHDALGRAVILLHQQHLGSGVGLLKLQQGLGPGGAEAIDALVLVAHHEDVVAGGCQQPEDGMLDFGGVLGLIYTEVGIPRPKALQNVGVLAEDTQSKDHLVVVVHQAAAAQKVLVTLVDGGKVHAVHLVLLDFLLSEHLVFAVCNVGTGLFDLKLTGKVDAALDQQRFDHGIEHFLVVCQFKWLHALALGVVLYHHGADTVDGPES